MSPISTTKLTATIRSMPRSACSASTTGQRPTLQELGNCRLNPGEALLPYSDGFDVLLEHDLIGWTFEILLLKPTSISGAPVLLAREDPAMAEQKRAHLLLVHTDCLDRGGSRSNQIPHRFMHRIRNPYGRQLAGPQQACKRGGIAPVRLYPVARLTGDQ